MIISRNLEFLKPQTRLVPRELSATDQPGSSDNPSYAEAALLLLVKFRNRRESK